MSLAVSFASARPPRILAGRQPGARARRSTWEELKDMERLVAAIALAHARWASEFAPELARAARNAFRNGVRLFALPSPSGMGAARARYLRALAEAVAAARLLGRLRTLRAAEEAAGRDISSRLLFAEIFPRSLPPERVIEFIRALPAVERAQWEAFVREHERIAFTLAGVGDRAILEKLRDLIAESLDAGLTPAQFDRLAHELLRNFQVEPRRLFMAWRDTTTDAVNLGRREEAQDPQVRAVLPFFLFDAINDAVVRPNHAALDDALAPVEWWEGPGFLLMPRLGFNCRCRLLPLSTRGAAQALAGSAWRIDLRGVPPLAGPDANFVRMV